VQKVGTRLRCVIGDETGVTNAFLPESKHLYEGEFVVLFNARSELVKEHIEIQLDKRGRVEKSRREVPRVNEEFNISQEAWVPIE
jgi:hypothetical protein